MPVALLKRYRSELGVMLNCIQIAKALHEPATEAAYAVRQKGTRSALSLSSRSPALQGDNLARPVDGAGEFSPSVHHLAPTFK